MEGKINFEYLYASGNVAKTIESGDTFLIGRPDPKRFDKWLLMAIDQADLKAALSPDVPYLVWEGLLSQSGGSNPTAVVLQNTLGDIDWQYSFGGGYNGILTGAFPQAKSTFDIQKFALTDVPPSSPLYVNRDAAIFRVDDDTVSIYTMSAGDLADGVLDSTHVVIKVFK